MTTTASAGTDLLDRVAAAKRLGISKRTLDRLISTGNIPIVRIGGLIRFRPSSLDDFVEARETRVNPRKKGALAR